MHHYSFKSFFFNFCLPQSILEFPFNSIFFLKFQNFLCVYNISWSHSFLTPSSFPVQHQFFLPSLSTSIIVFHSLPLPSAFGPVSTLVLGLLPSNHKPMATHFLPGFVKECLKVSHCHL